MKEEWRWGVRRQVKCCPTSVSTPLKHSRSKLFRSKILLGARFAAFIYKCISSSSSQPRNMATMKTFLKFICTFFFFSPSILFYILIYWYFIFFCLLFYCLYHEINPTIFLFFFSYFSFLVYYLFIDIGYFFYFIYLFWANNFYC